jgi:ADP-ribose pyrophosphatase YjhB (NUDIX family)
MKIEDFAERIHAVGVLYVDVHPFSWDRERGVQVLVLRRNSSVVMPGQWQTVSGKLAAGEPISRGFSRQLAEKTDLKAIKIFKMAQVATFYDENYDTVMLVPNVLAFVPFADITMDAEVHDAWDWVSLSEAADRLHWPTQLRAVEAMGSGLEWANGQPSPINNQFEITEIFLD